MNEPSQQMPGSTPARNIDERSPTFRIERERSGFAPMDRIYLIDEVQLRWLVTDLSSCRLADVASSRDEMETGDPDAECRAFVRNDRMAKLYTFRPHDSREPTDAELIRQFREAEFIGVLPMQEV